MGGQVPSSCLDSTWGQLEGQSYTPGGLEGTSVAQLVWCIMQKLIGAEELEASRPQLIDKLHDRSSDSQKCLKYFWKNKDA